MRKYGKHSDGCRQCLCRAAAVFVVALAGCCGWSGCRSSHSSVSSEVAVASVASSSVSVVDSARVFVDGAVISSGSSDFISEDILDVVLSRDSCGRIIGVSSRHRSKASEAVNSFRSMSADISQSSGSSVDQASAAAYHVGQKAKEAQTVVDPSAPIEDILDAVLMGLLLICLLYLLFNDAIWPCIKRKISR